MLRFVFSKRIIHHNAYLYAHQKYFSSGQNQDKGTIYYTGSHEWLKPGLNSDVVRIGITDHAQRELGDISFVVPPKVGKKYEKDQDTVVIESVKAVGEIKMPISGTIVGINSRLDQEASLINSDPEGEGWLFSFKIDVDSNKELVDETGDFFKKLMNKNQYREYLDSLKK